MIPPPQHRALEWATLIGVVILVGLALAITATLRERDERFDRIQSALARIESKLATPEMQTP